MSLFTKLAYFRNLTRPLPAEPVEVKTREAAFQRLGLPANWQGGKSDLDRDTAALVTATLKEAGEPGAKMYEIYWARRVILYPETLDYV